ncbi:hypothetical protein RB213_005415 [Colletotrichum asianum]
MNSAATGVCPASTRFRPEALCRTGLSRLLCHKSHLASTRLEAASAINGRDIVAFSSSFPVGRDGFQFVHDCHAASAAATSVAPSPVAITLSTGWSH